MARQLSLLKPPRRRTKLWWIAMRSVYGGSLNYRKVRRPFDRKMLTHVVFKARLGRAFWFSRSEARVRETLNRVAARYGVRCYDLAVNHDHIHVLIHSRSRQAHTKFLRLFSAEMGRAHRRLRRQMGLAGKALWVARPFTRLVSWGRRSLERVRNYIRKNRDEALGFLQYKPRNHALAKFISEWESSSLIRALSSA